jgi:hypothetical protein
VALTNNHQTSALGPWAVVGQPTFGSLQPARQLAASAAADIAIVLRPQAIGGQAGDQGLNRITINVEFHQLLRPIAHEAAYRRQVGIPLSAPSIQQLSLANKFPHLLFAHGKLTVTMQQARSYPILTISEVEQQNCIGVVAQDFPKQAIGIEAADITAVNQVAVENKLIYSGEYGHACLDVGPHDAANLAAATQATWQLLVNRRMARECEQLGDATSSTLIEADCHNLWERLWLDNKPCQKISAIASIVLDISRKYH